MTTRLNKLTKLADSLDDNGLYTLSDAVDAFISKRAERAEEFVNEPTAPGKVNTSKPLAESSSQQSSDKLTPLQPEENMKTVDDSILMVHKLKEMLVRHPVPIQWDKKTAKDIRWLLQAVWSLT